MFLTRMGRSAKFLITGNLTQISLPPTQASSLISAIECLDKIKGISIVKFDKKDILHHPLISQIVYAYEE